MTSDWQFVFDEPAFEQMQAMTLQKLNRLKKQAVSSTWFNRLTNATTSGAHDGPLIIANTARQIDVLLTKIVALTLNNSKH